MAVDSSGSVYFSNENAVFKIDASGVLTLLAGNGRPGFAGDGGPATDALLDEPQGVAVDTAGQVYIADRGNHRVRKIDTAGLISTVAGNGSAGGAGEGGQATDAQLNAPTAVVVDGDGYIFIADPATHCVRKIYLDGAIVTFAGNCTTGATGFFGDKGAAILSLLTTPEGLALDHSGNVYIADSGNNNVRKVSDGVITTIAGNQTRGFSGDGGAATSAELNQPYDVAVDSSGSLYIAQYGDGRVRKVDSKGVISTIAGNGTPGFGGDGGSATSAQLLGVKGIAADSSGSILIADSGNNRIRKVSNGGTISTLAGNGQFSYSGDGSTAFTAQFNGPQGAAIDANGVLYVADTGNHRVRAVSPKGVVTTIAGNGTPGFTGDGAAATNAQLNLPTGVAVDKSGAIYIADSGNNRVRVISPQGVISTVAGNGSPGSSGDGGPATSAQIYAPTGVALDANGNLYIAEFESGRVRKVSFGVISTVAGSGVGAYAGDGGPASSAYLHGPAAVAIDAAGDLFIADAQNNCVREVTPDGVIVTVAGTGAAGYLGDGGPAVNAQLVAPTGVTVDAAGNLYITETSEHVRKVALDGTISTIAGSGPAGYSGDGGDASQARLNGPSQISIDATGNLYFAETGNNVIRTLRPSR